MTFVRTDASRKITLVSPLAASGWCGGRASRTLAGSGALLALSAVVSGGDGQPSHGRKSQVVLPRAAAAATATSPTG